jgi:AraC-like DNA-binding protein
MKIIFLVGVIQAVFLALLIFGKRKKSAADFVLAIWMLFYGIHLLFQYFRITGLNYKYEHLLGIDAYFPILQGAFLFVYVSVLTNESGKFKKSYLYHGVLFLAISIYCTFDFYILGAEEKLNYVLSIDEAPPVFYMLTLPLNYFVGPIYVVWSLLILRKYKKQIANNFSYTEQINLNWLKYILYTAVAIWGSVIIDGFFGEYIRANLYEFVDELTFILVTLTIFILGYFGFKQPSIYTDDYSEKAQIANKKLAGKLHKKQKINADLFQQRAERYGKSGLKKTETEEHVNNLMLYMENEKPYLDSKLSLKQLAAFLELSTNHTSQIINENLNKNFFDFVNDYRINEVKKYLSDSKFSHYTLLAIAYECGFNSKSSFNSIFKLKTGLTPSEYQKTLTT